MSKTFLPLNLKKYSLVSNEIIKNIPNYLRNLHELGIHFFKIKILKIVI